MNQVTSVWDNFRLTRQGDGRYRDGSGLLPQQIQLKFSPDKIETMIVQAVSLLDDLV